MPEICIITNIGLEHQQYLGPTLAQIATEKAGIIKPGVSVVSAVDSVEAGAVITTVASVVGSDVTMIHGHVQMENLGLRGPKQLARIQGHEFELGLIGPHQILNAACAWEALSRLAIRHDRFPWGLVERLSDGVLAHGLKFAAWPGRFEILSQRPLVVLDGAHNPTAMKMLVETWHAFLAAKFGWKPEDIDGRARIVFGSVADKDVTEMAQLLRPLAKEVSLVRLANERTADPRQLAPAFEGLPITCYDSVAEAWQSVQNADPSSVTLITGSLFLVGEMLARRQGIGEEYQLNERLEKPAASR